jgi:hypothetical protein
MQVRKMQPWERVIGASTWFALALVLLVSVFVGPGWLPSIVFIAVIAITIWLLVRVAGPQPHG